MTFLVAFARPDFALLASDTRMTFRRTPDGPPTGFDDAGVKTLPWETGWLASGPSLRWRDAVVAGADPIAATNALVPGEAQIVRARQFTFITGRSPAGCFRRMLNYRWQEQAPGPHVVSACPESDPAALQQLMNAYAATVAHDPRRGFRPMRLPLPDVLRETAKLYAEVRRRWDTISGLLSVGLVFADGRRELLGPMPHDEVLLAKGLPNSPRVGDLDIAEGGVIR